MRPLPLEQAYRNGCDRGSFDLSSSASVTHTARELLGSGSTLADLLGAPLDYGPAGGSHELREAIASQYAGLTSADVLATAGASEAIKAVAMAAVRPGNRVVVQSSSYPALRAAPADLGAEVLEWEPGDDFEFDLGDIGRPEFAGAIAVFLNTPHGPSGTILRGAYDGPARLVADEVYRPIELAPATKPRSVVELSETAVGIGDLSKPLGLGGLRIGWIATRDRAFLRDCAHTLDHLSGSVATVSAQLAVHALRRFDGLLASQLVRARHNLSTLAAFMDTHAAWLDWVPPQAGYTAFVRFRGGDPGRDFYEELRHRGVFLLGGSAFGQADFARVGFGLERAGFEAALSAFGEHVRRLPSADCQPPLGDVIVLAKEPRPGYTKTRLAAAVGADASARLSDIFLRRTLCFAEALAGRLYVSFAPNECRDAFEARAPDATLIAQPDGDLGNRLESAFRTALEDGARRPVLIGSDSPTLPPHLLRSAHRLLASHDVVLGPAEDGGYYLIGMNGLQPELFRDIAWSESVVLGQTLARAADAGLRVATLPYWYDIDTPNDLARLEGAL